MDNPYEGWSDEDEQSQRQRNKRDMHRYATDELVRELNRRGYEVAYTDPGLGMCVVKVLP